MDLSVPRACSCSACYYPKVIVSATTQDENTSTVRRTEAFISQPSLFTLLSARGLGAIGLTRGHR